MTLKKVQVTQFLHQQAISMTSYPVHVDSALLITLYSIRMDVLGSREMTFGLYSTQQAWKVNSY